MNDQERQCNSPVTLGSSGGGEVAGKWPTSDPDSARIDWSTSRAAMRPDLTPNPDKTENPDR